MDEWKQEPDILGKAPELNYGGLVYGDYEFKDAQRGIILKSPDGSRFRVQVDDAGALTVTEI
jgi:hypothetical protein